MLVVPAPFWHVIGTKHARSPAPRLRFRNACAPLAHSARQSAMNHVVWRTIGTLLIVAGGVVIAFAYATRPSAASCSYVNQVNQSLGQPASCSMNPSAAVFIAAGVLALAGVLILVNARRPG